VAARKLDEKSHGEVKLAPAEIRELVQGIHPTVLSDRELDATIFALAGRCPVPVEVDLVCHRRPPEAAETAAYFVVAEALANVAKHSGASEAHAAVWREPEDRLVVEVPDGGKGGVGSESGINFTGLADRLTALDGRLFLESPGGGSTCIRAGLPLDTPDRTLHGTP
jgi:signal transduction histidine kinase